MLLKINQSTFYVCLWEISYLFVLEVRTIHKYYEIFSNTYFVVMSMLKIGMESKECTYYFTLLMSTFDVYFNLRAKKKKSSQPNREWPRRKKRTWVFHNFQPTYQNVWHMVSRISLTLPKIILKLSNSDSDLGNWVGLITYRKTPVLLRCVCIFLVRTERRNVVPI